MLYMLAYLHPQVFVIQSSRWISIWNTSDIIGENRWCKKSIFKLFWSNHSSVHHVKYLSSICFSCWHVLSQFPITRSSSGCIDSAEWDVGLTSLTTALMSCNFLCICGVSLQNFLREITCLLWWWSYPLHQHFCYLSFLWYTLYRSSVTWLTGKSAMWHNPVRSIFIITIKCPHHNHNAMEQYIAYFIFNQINTIDIFND